MPRHRSLVAAVVSAAVLAALAGGLAGQAPEPGRAYPAADWPFTGGDWSSSRYSTLDAISADTVDRLGAAWATPLPGGASSRATPVVKDGVIYLTGGANVFAFDARTGDPVWRWEAGSRPGGGGEPRRGRGRRWAAASSSSARAAPR